MRNIVLVDLASSGVNYIADIVHRNFNPVVLESISPKAPEVRARETNHYYSLTPYPVDVIKESASYEETLEAVRKLDPVIVIPGAEFGVALATRLADDLNLKGTPASQIPCMKSKLEMQKALEKVGMRYIRGAEVSSVEEAIKFCEENNLKTAVVKPLMGSGSNNLFLCDNLDEMEKAVAHVLKSVNNFGQACSTCLVQERIVGTEYIVNIAVCNGTPRMTSLLRYQKWQTEEGGYIYDYLEFIDQLQPGHGKLIEYAFNTVRALGIQYGMVHGEFMIDDQGPVLIEVNCRVMGCTMPADYLDQIYGQHETDSVLDAYLNPEKFMKDAEKPYRVRQKGYVKILMVPKELESESLPILEFFRCFPSVYSSTLDNGETQRHFKKTNDYATCGGTIYMVNEDRSVLERDLEAIRMMERDRFSYIISDGTSRKRAPDSTPPHIDFQRILKETSDDGSILIVAEEELNLDNITTVTADEIDKVEGTFNKVIIALQNSLCEKTDAEVADTILNILKFVSPAGQVVIPEGCYTYFANEREGAEQFVLNVGFTLEAPCHRTTGLVIGTRER